MSKNSHLFVSGTSQPPWIHFLSYFCLNVSKLQVSISIHLTIHMFHLKFQVLIKCLRILRTNSHLYTFFVKSEFLYLICFRYLKEFKQPPQIHFLSFCLNVSKSELTYSVF